MDKKVKPPLARNLDILIADDDFTFLNLAESALAPNAARIDMAHDGAHALGNLLDQTYDLAVLDLSMPQNDGFRLLSYIRCTSGLSDLPVVVITSRDDEEAAKEVNRLGADLMLVKPVDWTLLPSQISDVVRARNEGTEAA
ncbi:MAG: response regulator [Pseudomonadota bacterium]